MTKNYIAVASLLVALSLSVPAITSAAPTAVDINSPTYLACIGRAVAVRDNALTVNFSNYGTAVSNAYAVRTASFATNYAGATSYAVVKAANNLTWKNFNTAVKAIANNWKNTRATIWNTFNASSLACKTKVTPPPALSDVDNISVEVSPVVTSF